MRSRIIVLHNEVLNLVCRGCPEFVFPGVPLTPKLRDGVWGVGLLWAEICHESLFFNQVLRNFVIF